MNREQFAYADSQTRQAMKRYHASYNGTLHAAAVNGKGNTYENALLDEASAICGHPSYRLSSRLWPPKALAFLERFANVS